MNLSLCTGLSGFIRNDNDGEPIAYASIIIKKSLIGTTSDIYGYFVIPNIPAGEHKVDISMIGYKTVTRNIIIDDTDVTLRISMSPEILTGHNIIVTGENTRFTQKTDVSTITLNPRDLKSPPSFLEDDAFRTFQLLPGVISQNDFSAAMIVRGGSPDESLVLLDNTQIYNPYHVGGIFSSFNTNALSSAEFNSGGFPSEYGGNLSSVLNLTTKEGNSLSGRIPENNWLSKYWNFSGIHGEMSLLSSNILLDGPSYRGSWFFSARRTYFDKLADVYYNYSDTKKNWNYYFWDTHFKIISTISPKHRITISNYSGIDDLFINAGGNDLPEVDFLWVWGNRTYDINWKYFHSPRFLLESGFSFAHYYFDVDFQFFISRESTFTDSSESSGLDLLLQNMVKDKTFYQKLSWYLTTDHTLKIGYYFKNIKLKYEELFAGSTIRNWNQEPDIVEVYFNDHWKYNSIFILDTGVRISKYSLYNKHLFDPRINLKYFLSPGVALKFSWGKYSQFLFTINQDDQLLRIVDFWQPIMKGYAPQTADHYIIGIDYAKLYGYKISLEAYYKPYHNILDISKIYHPSLGQNGFVSGTGKAYGVELLIKKIQGKLTGWITYAYSKSKKTIDYNENGQIEAELGEKFSTKFDMPHMLKFVANYNFTEKKTLSISCVTQSGQPFTPPSGKVFHQGLDIFGSVDNPYQRFTSYYGQKNSARYPTYFRLDLGYSIIGKFLKYDAKYKIQIINLTNTFNILMYNWDLESSPSKITAYSMFPILVSVGMEIEL
jgi:hypothetical protein